MLAREAEEGFRRRGRFRGERFDRLRAKLRDEPGGVAGVRGLAAFSAKGDGREIRAVGLDHECIGGRGRACRPPLVGIVRVWPVSHR